MKLQYVNIKGLKSPQNFSKSPNKKDTLLIDSLKKRLNQLDNDVFNHILSKYQIPSNCKTKEDIIHYLSNSRTKSIENDLNELKRNYFEERNILLRNQIQSLERHVFSIFISKFNFPSKVTKRNIRIDYILEEYPYEKIVSLIDSSKRDHEERQKRKMDIENQLKSLNPKSLEEIFNRFKIPSYLNEKDKINSLLSLDLDMIQSEMDIINAEEKKRSELKRLLNSLNDEEINRLYNSFFDFGDFLKRKDKINALSKIDKENLIK